MIKPRFFNSIEYLKEKGMIIKTSKDDKMKDEINWYIFMKSLNFKFMPKLYKYTISDENKLYLEYITSKTLHEYYLNNEIIDYEWENIFDEILDIIEENSKIKIELELEIKLKTIKNMYLNKTLNRLNMVRENSSFKKFFNNEIIINEKNINL